MLRPRIIPFLLLNKDFLEKTEKFKNPKYVGDPLNAVKIFNEKQADEIAIVDYTASADKREINFDLLKKIAEESRMPVSYSGGIKSVADASKLISFGIEKICISSSYFSDASLCSQLISAFGSQSVVVVFDIKKNLFGKYCIYTNQGKNLISSDLYQEIKKACETGVGEIVINNISLDGSLKGYDLNLAREVFDICSVPVTFVGGAGNYDDFTDLIDSTGIVGCGSGSMFVFKGKYKAVLINYPSIEKRLSISGNIN